MVSYVQLLDGQACSIAQEAGCKPRVEDAARVTRPFQDERDELII